MYFLIFLFLVCITPNADAYEQKFTNMLPFIFGKMEEEKEPEPFKASPKSYHLIADLNECDAKILDDADLIEVIMDAAVEEGGFHLLKGSVHKFEPQGVTALYMLTESHLSIHTWPETGYAAVDLFTCGSNSPEEAVKFIKKKLECKRGDYALLERRSEFKSIETVK